jgi:acyl-CoA thioester hydrolase
MSSDAEPAVYKYQFVINQDVIDRNGHVNNVTYVQWMQDAAVSHSRAVLKKGIYSDIKSTWFARSHHIEYLSPAFAEDTIEVQTWLADCRRVRCRRKYRFVRISDNKLVAQGETDWVFVSTEDGKPKSIPDEIRNAFSYREDNHDA